MSEPKKLPKIHKTMRLSADADVIIDRILAEHPYLLGNRTAAIEYALRETESVMQHADKLTNRGRNEP